MIVLEARRRGVRIEALADNIGCSVKEMRDKLCGETVFYLNEAFAIHDAFFPDVPLDTLVWRPRPRGANPQALSDLPRADMKGPPAPVGLEKEVLSLSFRLKVNKARFYALAKRYFPELGGMSETRFIRYPRVREYGLEFRVGEDWHSLFLFVCGGRVCLGDERTTRAEDGSRLSTWESRTLELAEIKRLGMLEAAPVRDKSASACGFVPVRCERPAGAGGPGERG